MPSLWKKVRQALHVGDATNRLLAVAAVLAALATVYASYDWLRVKLRPVTPVLQWEFSPHILGFDAWLRAHDGVYLAMNELSILRCELKKLAKVVERDEQLTLQNILDRKKRDLDKLGTPTHESEAATAQRIQLQWEISDYEQRTKEASERFDATLAALKRCTGGDAFAGVSEEGLAPTQVAND